MRLTPVQMQVLQDSMKLVMSAADSVAALTYNRMFTLDPTLRALFHDDIEGQGRKLIATLMLVVQNLDQPAIFLPILRGLGQRHVSYGVQPEDYQQVGQALLWALSDELGEMFTTEMAEAWTALYKQVSSIMGEAAAAVASRHGLS